MDGQFGQLLPDDLFIFKNGARKAAFNGWLSTSRPMTRPAQLASQRVSRANAARQPVGGEDSRPAPGGAIACRRAPGNFPNNLPTAPAAERFSISIGVQNRSWFFSAGTPASSLISFSRRTRAMKLLFPNNAEPSPPPHDSSRRKLSARFAARCLAVNFIKAACALLRHFISRR